MESEETNKEPVFKPLSVSDLMALPERTHQEESEYRRGYRDGYIAAAQQAYDLWFLGKERAQDALFEHWRDKLFSWLRFESQEWIAPSCVIPRRRKGRKADKDEG